MKNTHKRLITFAGWMRKKGSNGQFITTLIKAYTKAEALKKAEELDREIDGEMYRYK